MWPWLSAAQRLLGRGPVQLSTRTVPLRTRATATEQAGTRWRSDVAAKTRPRDHRLPIEPVTRYDTAYDRNAPRIKRVYARPPNPHAHGPRGPRTKPAPTIRAQSKQPKSKPKPKPVEREHPPHREWSHLLTPRQLEPPAKADLYGISQFAHLAPHADRPPTASVLLRSFLEADHARTEPSRRYNAHAVVALYHASKRSGGGEEFRKMSSRHYSLLIALFGALSVLTSAYTTAVLPATLHRLPVAPTSALVQMVPHSYETEHWKFISLVVKDKQEAGHALGYIDHYWLMREALADAQRAPESHQRRLADVDGHLWRARAHYAQIQHAAKHPLAHTDLLAALIASGHPEHVEHALGCLQHILTDSGGLDVALQKVLWQLVLTQSALVSEPVRDDFLAELRRIVARPKTVPPPDSRSRRAPKTIVTKSGEVFRDVAPPTILDAYDALTDALFSPTQIQVHVDEGENGEAAQTLTLSNWAQDEAAAAFARTPDEAWQFLALLAAASPTAANIGEGAGEAQMPALSMHAEVLRTQRWVFVGALAALLRTEPGAEARDIVAACWRLWRSATVQAPALPDIERALLLALVRLAGLTGHNELVEEMLDALPEREMQQLLLPQEDYVRTGPFGDTGRAGAALELGAACVLCSGRTRVDWRAVQVAVQHAGLVDSRGGWRNFANQLLRHVLRVRGPRAADLLRALRASPKRVKLADQVVVELVQGLASTAANDTLALAVQLHAEHGGAMARTKVAAMLVALTRGIFRHRLARVHEDVARGLLASIVRADYRPLPGTREHAHFRWTLSTAARSGAHKEVVALLRARLRQGDGDEFSTRFLVALAGSLLTQRQFKLAAGLLRAVPPAHPARSPLANLVVARASRASARTVAATVSGYRGTAALRKLFWRARWSEVHPDPRGALSLRQLLARTGNTARQLRTAVQLLVRAGRARAASRFFRVAATSGAADARAVTAMGNALLGSRLQPRPRRRLFRQIRAVLAKLSELAADSGGAFAADRVTVNVLLKAVVHWDLAVGPAQLRFLFNALVASGYPGTPLDGPDVAPFELGRVKGVLQDVHGQPLHYVRHVRPLYKLLIAAFRARRDREAVQHLLTALAAAREEWAARERVRLVKSAVTRRRLWHARRRALQ